MDITQYMKHGKQIITIYERGDNYRMYVLEKNTKWKKEWYYPSGGPPSGIIPLQTRNYSAQVESN